MFHYEQWHLQSKSDFVRADYTLCWYTVGLYYSESIKYKHSSEFSIIDRPLNHLSLILYFYFIQCLVKVQKTEVSVAFEAKRKGMLSQWQDPVHHNWILMLVKSEIIAPNGSMKTHNITHISVLHIITCTVDYIFVVSSECFKIG